MHNAARKLEARAVYQEFAEVISAGEGGLRVRTALTEFTARRAKSCLIAPSRGDRVLIATEEGGETFVLAVLEGEEQGATTIAAEGDLVLRAARGKVEVAAQEGVNILSAGPVSVLASAVEVAAARGKLAAQWLDVVGEVVKAEVGKVKLLASTFDSVLERYSQRVKRSYRTVEETDQVRARQIDYAADGNAQIRGENTLVTAIDVVKVNADQVHLG